ncbi:kinase-like protein [Exidia glandulosa HHB12029]|uniref:Kinase-like protein n=1 Tax=Exidia glandulosa HHB12029 TaxID=1314781 RepID=A0A165BSR2_EXIGL|nr:kinase-like protein [Exidia glandulosa HHB12029]
MSSPPTSTRAKNSAGTPAGASIALKEAKADVPIVQQFAALFLSFLKLADIDRVSSLVGGIGGTASVRLASYRDQPVAIKIVPATHASEKFVKRLAREIAVWRTLSHKNILPLYGLYYYAEERVPAMVSPWCANGNIVEYLAARSHLPAADMAQLQLRLLLDTLEGLACLHHERIVHGDLKGANILVLSDGTACVADFGVSTVLCDQPHSASAAGTFRWMAPELLDDDNSLRTRESDMWALDA